MKRIITLILLLFLLSCPVFAAEPNVAAIGAALIDGKTGRMLWEKNGESPLAMASTTKIMTAILVLERENLEDTTIISRTAAAQPEVHMDLKEGEEWQMRDLLSAMMLRSYNDAAVALAEAVSGSVEVFCAEMTEKAAEIGAKDTVFGTPNGLDSHLSLEEHHSTAYDMALIAAYALENPTFREIITQPAVSVSDKTGKHVCEVTNTDRLLREYAGALGVKTGYTNRAGHCFVGAAERDGVRLVSTVLGSGWGTAGKEKKWTDTKAILDYGFANYVPFEAVRKGTVLKRIPVLESPVESVELVLGDSYTALFSEEEKERLCMKVSVPQKAEAPVSAGMQIGMAELWLDEEKLAEIPLLAKEDAPVFTLGQRLERLSVRWLSWRKF